MNSQTKMVLGAVLAGGLMFVNLPPSFGAQPAAAQRVVVDAPDPPAEATQGTPPAGNPGPAAAKTHSAGPVLTHVRKLGASDVASLQKKYSSTISSDEGHLTASFKGSDGGQYKLVLEDGTLKSGLQVVAISFAKLDKVDRGAQAASNDLLKLPAAAAYANTAYFMRCSYATQSNYWSNLYVHICPIDVFFLSGSLGLVSAMVGGMVGAIIGNAPGAVVGVAVGTVLGFISLYFLWQNMAWDGSVSFTIPNYTLMPPYGGWVYINSGGHWDYMPNQCWIQYQGVYYEPYC